MRKIVPQVHCKVVTVQSSSIHLYNVLRAVEATDGANCVFISKQIRLKLARRFLRLLGTKENDIETMVQY